MKNLIETHKQLYALAILQGEQFKKTLLELGVIESKIKHKLKDDGIESFNTAYGDFSVEDKTFFNVLKADKEKEIEFFKSDNELRHLVKTKEAIHWKSADKIYRDMYEAKNIVPPFVNVSPVTVIDFKPIDGIKPVKLETKKAQED